MDGLRSICFVYGKQDSYNACYLKNFFKWIGFSYMDFLYNEKTNIFDRPEKCRFDIIVDLNGALPAAKRRELFGRIDSCFLSVDTEDKMTEWELLEDLLEKVEGKFLQERRCQLLRKLSRIYEKYHMVNILYGYTFVLLEQLDSSVCDQMRERCGQALSEVEETLRECADRPCQSQKPLLTEYALYARYDCMRRINELLLQCGSIEKFSIQNYLDEADRIYELDKGFYKIEFLKAQAAQQDSRFRGYTRLFLENCVKQCRVDVCRSYHYYSLGKWKEQNRQPYEAERYYHLSWENDPSNIKAIFKLAVENIKTGKANVAKDFFQMLLDTWSDQDDKGMMPPKEIEYAYKARFWMAKLENDQLWNLRGKEFLNFIRLHGEANDWKADWFMKKMYGDDEMLKSICEAMLHRIQPECVMY